jgi:hypothetical protein
MVPQSAMPVFSQLEETSRTNPLTLELNPSATLPAEIFIGDFAS